MTTLMLIGGLACMVFLYGYVQRKRGAAKVKQEIMTREIELVKKANKIEDDHKHDSRSDIIDGL